MQEKYRKFNVIAGDTSGYIFVMLGRTEVFVCGKILQINNACSLKRFEHSYKPVKYVYYVRGNIMGIRNYWEHYK